MDYKRYADLPQRIIVSSQQKSGLKTREKKLVAYGIMGKVKGTNKWLMVRNRNTAAFSFLLYGAYQPIHLENLLESLTSSELLYIKKIVLGGIDIYNQIFRETFNHSPNSAYAYYRLDDFDEYILDFEADLPDETPYSFPKGRRNPKEDTIVTAWRELYEETGVEEMGSVIPTPVCYTVEGLAGRNYTAKCWLAEYDREIPLEGITPIDTNEIAGKDWIEIDISSLDINSTKNYGVIGEKKVFIDSFSIKLLIEAQTQGLLSIMK